MDAGSDSSHSGGHMFHHTQFNVPQVLNFTFLYLLEKVQLIIMIMNFTAYSLQISFLNDKIFTYAHLPFVKIVMNVRRIDALLCLK